MKAVTHANRFISNCQRHGENNARTQLAVGLAKDGARLVSGHTDGGKVTRVYRLNDGSVLGLTDEAVVVQASRMATK
jgi:hypothetical protein